MIQFLNLGTSLGAIRCTRDISHCMWRTPALVFDLTDRGRPLSVGDCVITIRMLEPRLAKQVQFGGQT